MSSHMTKVFSCAELNDYAEYVHPGSDWATAVNYARRCDAGSKSIAKLGIALAAVTTCEDVNANLSEFSEAAVPPFTDTEAREFYDGFLAGHQMLLVSYVHTKGVRA